MIPKQSLIEIPLLQVLHDMGGEGVPKEIYPLVAVMFPELTEDDMQETVWKGTSNKWTNRVQWTRQSLINAGDMVSPKRGVWAITEQGKSRLQNGEAKQADTSKAVNIPSANLVSLYEEYEEQFRSKLLDQLFQLSPTQFEHFSRDLLAAYGFTHMAVTQVSSDGGIDGHGKLKVGLAHMNVAFQSKRWEGNIGRPEIDKFRGAIQGSFEQGLFLTTSDFTKGATDASIKQGAVPVILLNGQSIVQLMIEKEFGVVRRPLHIYEDQIEGIFGDDE